MADVTNSSFRLYQSLGFKVEEKVLSLAISTGG